MQHVMWYMVVVQCMAAVMVGSFEGFKKIVVHFVVPLVAIQN